MRAAVELACELAAVPPLAAALSRRWLGSPHAWLLVATGNVLMAVALILQGLWPEAVPDGICALIALWIWWHHRKGRRRLRALLSGKYQHVKDAMVRVMRERRAPRPVPVPG